MKDLEPIKIRGFFKTIPIFRDVHQASDTERKCYRKCFHKTQSMETVAFRI